MTECKQLNYCIDKFWVNLEAIHNCYIITQELDLKVEIKPTKQCNPMVQLSRLPVGRGKQ